MLRRGAILCSTLALLGQAGAGASAADAPSWMPRAAGASFSAALVSSSGQRTSYAGSAAAPEARPADIVLSRHGRACGLSTGAAAADALVVWSFDAPQVSATADTITANVSWHRRVQGELARWQPDLDRTRVLSVADGDTVTLDYVVVPRELGLDASCDSVTLEVQPQLAEFVNDAAIGYDLWLIRNGGSGTTFERFQTAGRPASDVEYFFAPERRNVQDSAGRALTLDVSVSGKIRGHARPDGRVDLALTMTRGVGVTGDSTGVANFGKKLLTLAPGETIEVRIPPVTQAVPDVPDLQQLLATEQTTLRIGARRIR